MKALKTGRRVAPALAAPGLQINPEEAWRRCLYLLPSVFAVLGVVTIECEDHGALVRLASSGALAKGTGGEVSMLNQNRVRMKLERLEQAR